MNIVEARYSAHTVYLEPFTGQGAVVMPCTDDDMAFGPTSLHAASWDAMVRDLRHIGYEPVDDDETGLVSVIGYTADGRDVLALLGRDPIISEPTLEEMAEALLELMSAAHVEPGGPVS